VPDWKVFGQALAATPPGNNGGILLPWFEPEIVPRVNKPGIHRFELDAKGAAANCRAVVEAQMMSMRLHSQWMKVKPTAIYATGGASQDLPVLQVMADVFNCPVLRIEVTNSAALGAALRAAHGWLLHAGQKPVWRDIVADFTAAIHGSEVKPNPQAVPVYDKLTIKYAECERSVL
jgi:xylulokinase